jgi:DmsE family decaheme c-type cytochrome
MRANNRRLVLAAAIYLSLAWSQTPAAPQQKAPSQSKGPAPSQTTPPAPSQAQAAAPAQPAAAEYVGSEVCQTCHEDIFKAFEKSPHALLDTDAHRGWATKACESCHGPGSKHIESGSAEDIRQPAKLRPAETDRICLTCHFNQPTQAARINSAHAKNQVSCISCHSVHKTDAGPHGVGPAALVARKPTDVNRLCAGCHADIWASFQKPYKHRLPEGAMSCVDCHNPHGSASAMHGNIQLTRANEPACMNCHSDKVGPFSFEHAPVRLQGCTACHMPHGSANPRMLTRPQVQFVCLECHSFLPSTNAKMGTVPPAFHDLRSARFQNCTLCHQKVHGSYVDRALLK